MVQGISFSNFSVRPQQDIQKKQGNPPQEFMAKLQHAGIPSNIISQGKDSVEKYAAENDITLPQPPEPPIAGQKQVPPKGSKSQGATHANEHSVLVKETSSDIKSVMAENGIASTGTLKGDMVAIKAAVAFLDKEQSQVLKDKFKLAGMDLEEANKPVKQESKGAEHLAAMNKHFLVNKKAV